MKNAPKLRKLDEIGIQNHLKATCRNAGYYPLHSHDYFELELHLNGQGTMVLNGTPYTLTPGVTYLITPSDFHEMCFDDEYRNWNISFDGNILNLHQLEHLLLSERSVHTLDPDSAARLDSAANLLRAEKDLHQQRLLLEYILRTAGFWKDQKENLSPIQSAMLYIETFFRDDPSLAQTAAHVGLSPSYFGNLFKEIVGETYISYLNNCKINCATMLLKSGKSVTEACFDSGFGSLSGFRYTFHQKTGVSPKDYVTKELKR